LTFFADAPKLNIGGGFSPPFVVLVAALNGLKVNADAAVEVVALLLIISVVEAGVVDKPKSFPNVDRKILGSLLLFGRLGRVKLEAVGNRIVFIDGKTGAIAGAAVVDVTCFDSVFVAGAKRLNAKGVAPELVAGFEPKENTLGAG